MKRKNKKKGFTLIELIATMAVVGILMTVIFSLFSTSSSMLTSAEVDNEIQNEARMIVNLIEDDLKFGSKIKLNTRELIADLEGENIEFQRKDSNGINQVYRYKYNGEKKELSKIKIIDFGQPNQKEEVMGSISKNLEKFKVKYLKSEVFEITLKLAKNKTEYEYKSSIFPMNK